MGPVDESAEASVRRCAGAILAAYRRCEGDPRAVEALAGAIARERGFLPGGYCFFNDVRFKGAERISAPAAADARSVPGPDGWATELGLTDLRTIWRPGRQAGAKFFLFLEELEEQDESCRVTLSVDPGFRELGTAESFLGGLEALAVAAARDPEGPVAALVRLGANGTPASPAETYAL